MRTRTFHFLALLALAAGCDPNAKATPNEHLATPQDRLSRLHETCSRTADCVADLRCFDGVCRATKASVVGDYFAAVGARALAEKNGERALRSYEAAVNRYESDRIPVPLELLCARGRAMVAAGVDPKRGEAAALALHRCLRRAPVGSTPRTHALAGLSALDAVGLDPELLDRDEDMDRYLTKQPKQPQADSLAVEVTSDSKREVRTLTEFLAFLESEPVRAQFTPCWKAHWKATKKKTLTVTFPFRYRFYEGEFEDQDRDKLSISGSPPLAGSPKKCVYDVLAPIAEQFTDGKRTRLTWTADITLNIGS